MPLTDADREAIKACQPVPVKETQTSYVKDPYRKGWTSNAMGCHAEQVTEFNQVLAQHGLGESARFTPTGQFFADSKKARKEAMRIWGYHDRAAYYD